MKKGSGSLYSGFFTNGKTGLGIPAKMIVPGEGDKMKKRQL